MDLSVVTVTWNAKDEIGRQITSVALGCKSVSFEQFISDNGSTDGTVEIIRRQFPDVVVIENGKNLGFAAANNKAIPLTTGEFVLFLNPDMKVMEGSLDTLVSWMRAHPKAGIAGCRLTDETDTVNPEALPRRFPRVFDLVVMMLKLHHVFPSLLDRYLMKGFDATKEQEVDSVRGAFMLVRRDLVEQLGWGFDPRYFIWFEDVDLCRETKRLGYDVIYTPIVSCVDYVGQSFKKRDTLWKQKQFTKSMLTYVRKWEPFYVWMWIAVVRPVSIGFTRLHSRIGHRLPG